MRNTLIVFAILLLVLLLLSSFGGSIRNTETFTEIDPAISSSTQPVYKPDAVGITPPPPTDDVTLPEVSSSSSSAPPIDKEKMSKFGVKFPTKETSSASPPQPTMFPVSTTSSPPVVSSPSPPVVSSPSPPVMSSPSPPPSTSVSTGGAQISTFVPEPFTQDSDFKEEFAPF